LSGQLHTPDDLYPTKESQYNRDLVKSLILENIKNSCTCRDSKHNSLVVKRVA